MAKHGSRTLMLSLALLFWTLSSFVLSAHALLGNKWEATSFCKCICFGQNYSILHLDLVETPSKPCLTCTKQWCINQNLAICAGASLGDTDPDTATGKEGDVEARCFQRDSPRDQLVVTLFLLIIFGLLLGAGIKGRMVKAGLNEQTLGWEAGKKWWQTLLPSRQFENFSFIGRSSGSGANGRERGEYSTVSGEAMEMR